MDILLFLLIFPFAIALVLLLTNNDKARTYITVTAAGLISAGAVLFLVINFRSEVRFFDLNTGFVDIGMFIIELLLALYIFITSLKYKRRLITLLIIVQTSIMIAFRLMYASSVSVTHSFLIDRLSLIMGLIVGIVGSLICVYSAGYMRDYQQENQGVKDNRRFFFFVIFAFLAAMFGLVFSNNLVWIFFFWEITTMSSFFLIGYSQTEEARSNSFCALEYNLWGGIAIILAVVYLQATAGTVELSKIMTMGKAGVMLPVALICFAGITKSAQFPFSKWLLGAMVAPTPVSALLHSSTMVKAGVYIILRFALVLQGSTTGYMIASVGGVTFMIGSLIAISQQDAKKVLAYSTIANLGLIVLCAGVGTCSAMWAAILLIIFHAVTKCLLFLCVGVVDDKTGSRNIEDMTGLIIRLPKISIMMQIGIVGMFLAPFGMLISKWAVIKALVDYNPILLIFVVLGGAATVFFWVKWMGTLILVLKPQPNLEAGIYKSIWVPLYTLAVGTVLLVGFLPLLSDALVEPYIMEIYNRVVDIGRDNMMIMSMMLVLVLLFPLSFINYGKKVKVIEPYLSGANIKEGPEFYGKFGKAQEMSMKGYYLERYFGEHKLFRIGFFVSLILIGLAFGVLWV